MPDAPTFLSIVVPCYNEAGNIKLLYERLNNAAAGFKPQGVEIILIDDGSRDETWSYIQALCTQDKSVVGITLSRNFGHQMALACGLQQALGERVLIIDADLQDPPELLPEMMQKMDAGFDVVYGKRSHREGENFSKKVSAWLFYRVLNRLSDTSIPLDTGDFRLLRRCVLEALNAMPERVRFTRGLISWLGFKQTKVEYTRHERHTGLSHYPWRSMLRFAGEGITSFSTRPLQMAIWLGILMMGVSGLLLLYVFFSWLCFDTVRGWTSLAAIFLMSQALQWLMLGVIGNYLAVIFREAKGRPLYVIADSINRKN